MGQLLLNWEPHDPIRPGGGENKKPQCKSGFQFFKFLLFIKIVDYCLRDLVNISSIMVSDCLGTWLGGETLNCTGAC